MLRMGVVQLLNLPEEVQAREVIVNVAPFTSCAGLYRKRVLISNVMLAGASTCPKNNPFVQVIVRWSKILSVGHFYSVFFSALRIWLSSRWLRPPCSALFTHSPWWTLSSQRTSCSADASSEEQPLTFVRTGRMDWNLETSSRWELTRTNPGAYRMIRDRDRTWRNHMHGELDDLKEIG